MARSTQQEAWTKNKQQGRDKELTQTGTEIHTQGDQGNRRGHSWT